MSEESIAFDLDSLTLGELFAAEVASDLDGVRLLKSSAGRRLLAVFVTRLRSSGQPPSWSELESLRLLDGSTSSSDSSPASRGARSASSG